MKISQKLCALTLFLLTIAGFASQELEGAGGSFAAPVLKQWLYFYQHQANLPLSYLSIGSGRGIKLLQQNKIDFSCSEYPLSEEELNQKKWLQVPVVFGAVTPVYRLDGHTGTIKLTGPLLAKIFMGQISFWDDRLIKKLNPKSVLPHTPIVPVHRKYASGTTYLMTSYLNSTSQDWRKAHGTTTTLAWQKGIEAIGNAGMAASIGSFNGSIGYTNFQTARKYQLSMISLKNKAGKFLTAKPENFNAAAAAALWHPEHGFAKQNIMDSSHIAAWPIVGPSYLIFTNYNENIETTANMINFIDWVFKQGSRYAKQLHFVPLNAPSAKAIVNHLKNELKETVEIQQQY